MEVRNSEDLYDEIMEMIQDMDLEDALSGTLNALGDLVVMGDADAPTMGRRISDVVDALCYLVSMKSGIKISAQSELHEVQ